jgi:pSer/pThr/pTyr-binding forkhead associated (FHA) protein
LISVVFSEGPLAGELRELDRELTVGREDCDVQVDDHQISRRHLLLKPVGDVLHVEDLGSSNGTFVNGHRISEPVGAGDGDAIGVGTSELIVQVTAPPEPSMPHPVPAATGAVPSSGRPGPIWIVTALVEVTVILTALGFLVYYAVG